VTDTLKVEGEGDFEVSLVDAAIPTVFIQAEALGLKGGETPKEIDGNAKLLQRIEKIRSVAAQVMGLCKDWRKATHEVPYSPFFAICAPPMDYKDWTTGKKIPEKSVDLVVRLLFMQQMHKTYPVTGTTCTVVASMIPGTIANRLATTGRYQKGRAPHRTPGRGYHAGRKVVLENGDTW